MRAVPMESKASVSPRAGASTQSQRRLSLQTQATAAAVMRQAGERWRSGMDRTSEGREMKRSEFWLPRALSDGGFIERRRPWGAPVLIAILFAGVVGWWGGAPAVWGACDTNLGTPGRPQVDDQTTQSTAGGVGAAMVVSWAAVTGAEGYFIYRAPDPADQETCIGADIPIPYAAVFGPVNSFRDAEPPGGTFRYRVEAFSAGGICRSSSSLPSAAISRVCSVRAPAIESAVWSCSSATTRQLTLTASPGDALSFSWYRGSNLLESTDENKLVLSGAQALAGVYQVSVTFEGSCTPISEPITVGSYTCAQPIADFSFTNACPGSAVMFTYQQGSGPAPESFSWDFGDGTTSVERDPTHMFPAGGLSSYEVRLSVSYRGMIANKSKSVPQDFPEPRVAWQGLENRILQPSMSCEPVTLIAVRPDGTSYPAGTKYAWKRNGTCVIGCAQQPNGAATFIANVSGAYEVAVTGPICRRVSAPRPLTILPAPDARFELISSSQACETGSARSLSFRAVSALTSSPPSPMDPAVNLQSFDWTVAGGTDNTISFSGDTVTLSATSDASLVAKTVSVTTTATGFLCEGHHTEEIVLDKVPNDAIPFEVALVGRDETGRCAIDGSGENATIAAQVGYGSVYFRYDWFVDGAAVSSGPLASVEISGAGTYLVTCFITNKNGCTIRQSTSVTIPRCPPRVMVGVSPSAPLCAGKPVTFIDSTLYDAEYRFWDFGDGTYLEEFAPFSDPVAHSFPPSLEPFTVTLYAANDAGDDSATVTVQASLLPASIVGFSGSKRVLTSTSDVITFTGTSISETANGTFYPISVSLLNPETGLRYRMSTLSQSSSSWTGRLQDTPSAFGFIGVLEVSKADCSTTILDVSGEPLYVAYLGNTQALVLQRVGPASGNTALRIFSGTQVTEKKPNVKFRSATGEYLITGEPQPDGTVVVMTPPLLSGRQYSVELQPTSSPTVLASTPAGKGFKATTFALVVGGDRVSVIDADNEGDPMSPALSFVDLDPAVVGVQSEYTIPPSVEAATAPRSERNGEIQPAEAISEGGPAVTVGTWQSSATAPQVALGFVSNGLSVYRIDLSTFERPSAYSKHSVEGGPFLDLSPLLGTAESGIIVDMSLGENSDVTKPYERQLYVELFVTDLIFCSPFPGHTGLCGYGRRLSISSASSDPLESSGVIESDTTLESERILFASAPNHLRRIFPKRLIRTGQYSATSYMEIDRDSSAPGYYRLNVSVNDVTAGVAPCEGCPIEFPLVNQCTSGDQFVAGAYTSGSTTVIRDRGRIAYLDIGNRSIEQFTIDTGSVAIVPNAALRRPLDETVVPTDLAWALVKGPALVDPPHSRLYLAESRDLAGQPYGRVSFWNVERELPPTEDDGSRFCDLNDHQFTPIALAMRWHGEIVTGVDTPPFGADDSAWVMALDAYDNTLKAFDAWTGACVGELTFGAWDSGSFGGVACLVRRDESNGLQVASKTIEVLPASDFRRPEQQGVLLDGFAQASGWMAAPDENFDAALGRLVGLEHQVEAFITNDEAAAFVVGFINVAREGVEAMQLAEASAEKRRGEGHE